MSSHDPTLTLRQIIDFADEIGAIVGGRTREDLDTNREFRRALERCVELVGEDVVLSDVLWNVVTNDVPKLRAEVKLLLKR